MIKTTVMRWRWKSSDNSGLIHAASQLQAVKRLSDRGLQHITVYHEHFIKTPPPSRKEWLQTMSQWLELLDCGLPLPEALKHSVNHHSSRSMKWLVNDCQEAIKQGHRFSSALRNYSDWLPSSDLQTIEWAESSGQLTRGIQNIVTLKQQQLAMNKQLTKALRYPLMIAAVACAVALLMMTWVLPQFEKLFGNTGLPALTKNVLAISDFISQHALVFIGALCLTYVMTKVVRHYCPALWRRMTLKLPIYRQLLIGAREQQVFYQLGLSLDAGIDAVNTLRLTTNNLNCPVYKAQLELIGYHLQHGLGWSQAFNLSTLNSAKTMSFIQAAEKSGQIAQAFKQLGSYQQKQLEIYSERLSTYAQPLLMLILGGIIGTLLVAMYLPLFSLGKQF
ncbi:type II secretion system F family protein [Idiomarina sp. X4]|uniref:type II secretion system F family protein n=1 Tax=Idiomarina sp. X4 TaxID=2055892 RepID=UPI000C28DAD4|nr:type II secretion system F family protein [Idiomarina sp. X4]ATZ72803.1 type II secretion system F family protein [Idiomarina sp. X4]